MRRAALLFGWLWALPVTAWALAVVLLSGGYVHRVTWLGLQVMPRFGSALGRWMERIGLAAFTFGTVVVYRDGARLRRHRTHEETHVKQGMVLGPFLLLALAFGAAPHLERFAEGR